MKRKQGDGVSLADRDSSAQRARQAGADMMSVTVCCMDGTFEVTVKHNALVYELTDTVAESRGIANASRAVALFVAGEKEPLAGTQSVAGRMTDAGANELFMLLRDCNDRKVLEEIYHANDGANWEEHENWMTDTPVGEWDGVTADADGNVTEIDLSHNYNITALPDSIGRLLRLEKLDLTYCSELGDLPESLGELTGLQKQPGPPRLRHTGHGPCHRRIHRTVDQLDQPGPCWHQDHKCAKVPRRASGTQGARAL